MDAKSQAQNFYAKTASTHTQKQGLFEAGSLHFLINFAERFQVLLLLSDNIQPSQPLTFIGPRPERGVLLPKFFHRPSVLELFKLGFYQRVILAQSTFHRASRFEISGH